MEIIVGRNAGFCYGVKRAVEGAKQEIEKNEKDVFCLGEIVHNKQVVNSLEEQGIIFIEDIKEAKGKTIVRAHGISKEIYDKAKKKKIELKDYTCPNVLKIHEIAEKYAGNGYYIFLCGNKSHPENIGTASFCGKHMAFIEKEEEVLYALNQFEKSKIKKLLLISQTTYSLDKFHQIEEMIKSEISEEVELVIKNTICRATEIRQKETEELSKKVDCMIIIGGVNSSNTRKLYDIAKKNCKKSITIEKLSQLDLKEIENFQKVGIMAGASTPQNSIKEVQKKIECMINV